MQRAIFFALLLLTPAACAPPEDAIDQIEKDELLLPSETTRVVATNTLHTPEQTPVDSSFRAFVARFPSMTLPLAHDERARQVERNLPPLLTEHLHHVPGRSPSYGRHFAVGRLIIDRPFHVVLVKTEDPSGGYNDVYDLVTYTLHGDLIARQQVAHFAADVSFRTETTLAISPDLGVRSKQNETVIDTEGNETTRSDTLLAFQVTASGIIERVTPAQ